MLSDLANVIKSTVPDLSFTTCTKLEIIGYSRYRQFSFSTHLSPPPLPSNIGHHQWKSDAPPNMFAQSIPSNVLLATEEIPPSSCLVSPAHPTVQWFWPRGGQTHETVPPSAKKCARDYDLQTITTLWCHLQTVTTPADSNNTMVWPEDSNNTMVSPADNNNTMVWPADNNNTMVWPADSNNTMVWPADSNNTMVTLRQ